MKKNALVLLTLACSPLALVTACDPPRNRTDAATAPLDAFVILTDAYVAPGTDAAIDAAASETPDAFTPMMMGSDAGLDARALDAFVPGTDAFSADAFVPRDAPFASTPCEQIAAVRATNGTLSPAYPVAGAIVSYVMPVLPTGATDPRGVFVQCPGASGPALFLAISPDDRTAFPTAPVVGQIVSFSVTATLDTASGASSTGDQHRVTGITGWSAAGTGILAAEDVSAVALPAMIDAYESEIVSMDAVIASAGSAAGTGFTSFQITTTGVPTASADQRLRMPADVATSLGLVVGCQVRLTGTPLWRFTTAAQPSIWSASEIVVGTCPMPMTCTPATHLVINEIDYDQVPGADTAEFVEIHNPTGSAIPLTGISLVQVNGVATPVEYGRVALTGTLAAGGYLLVTASGSTVAGATLSLPEAMQNGPDGMILLGPDGIIDAAMYEGTISSVMLAGGMTLTISESASIGTDGANGLSRRPNGCDRDTPAVDWADAPLTPGAMN
ncbi:MAG: lamin tail domain-containing protein [Deltaproteobacteria bacterium]|nr:lamin tail domain-containing protein [Deltaproteobacteria bacterium]